MEYKKVSIISLKLSLVLFLVYLFFFLTILYEIANRFFYEENYRIIYWLSLIVICILVLIFQITFGFYFDRIYNKTFRTAGLFIVFLAFLLGILHIASSSISGITVSFREIVSNFIFSIEPVMVCIFFFFSFAVSFLGISIGCALRIFLNRAKK